MAEMQDASQPYSINMTVNGDPRTQMGFAWFTNPEVKSGKVQIVARPTPRPRILPIPT